MTLSVFLMGYAGFLGLFLLVALPVGAYGWFLSTRRRPHRHVKDSGRANTRRWLYILLGGPIVLDLIDGLFLLLSGEARFESQVLAIYVSIAFALAACLLSLKALEAAWEIGIMLGKRNRATTVSTPTSASTGRVYRRKIQK